MQWDKGVVYGVIEWSDGPVEADGGAREGGEGGHPHGKVDENDGEMERWRKWRDGVKKLVYLAHLARESKIYGGWEIGLWS